MKNLIIRPHKAALLTCFVACGESSQANGEKLQPEGVFIRKWPGRVGGVSSRRDDPLQKIRGSRSVNNAAVDDMTLLSKMSLRHVISGEEKNYTNKNKVSSCSTPALTLPWKRRA